jgi:hypothetical protein
MTGPPGMSGPPPGGPVTQQQITGIGQYNQSPEGMLTDWNAMTQRQGQPAMSMQDFAGLMKASGHVGAPNMEGYARMRQMLGFGVPNEPGFPEQGAVQQQMEETGDPQYKGTGEMNYKPWPFN